MSLNTWKCQVLNIFSTVDSVAFGKCADFVMIQYVKSDEYTFIGQQEV